MSDFVGYRALTVTDEALALTFPLALLYPSAAPGRPHPLGPYQLDVAAEAPVRPGAYPLVLISHGTGGSGLVYRNLAHFLARQGFVVGLPEHPHNNRADNSWANNPQNLSVRPRHLQLALDHLYADPQLAPHLRPDCAALIGHSLGAYSALALTGGRPQAWETPSGPVHQIPVPPADGRVRSLVLLAPAVPWLAGEGALRAVRLPILLLVGGKDEHTPPPHADIVRRGVPDPARVQLRVVDNAGHFAFLSPFPPERVSPAFPPSQDPPGFDRAAFQEEMHAEVLAFLRRTTSGGVPQ
jgi:predicted dienelactone hydrolase